MTWVSWFKTVSKGIQQPCYSTRERGPWHAMRDGHYLTVCGRAVSPKARTARIHRFDNFHPENACGTCVRVLRESHAQEGDTHEV